MSKVLVTGASGKTGLRLVRELVSRGQAVRVLLRGSDTVRLDPRVEAAIGDFMDSASLAAALDGISRMYLLSAGPDLEQHETNAIEAAKAARIELLVKHSVARAPDKSTGVLRRHRAGEERVMASGLAYVILRPDWFSSNALSWAETIKRQDAAYGILGDASLPIIDLEDIAVVAATVLTTDGHAGKTYELTGPETLTSEQQVAILADILGRPLKYVNIPDGTMRERMSQAGVPPRQVDSMMGLFESLRNAGHVEPSSDVKAILGREARSFRQWAQTNIAAFRPEQVAQNSPA